VSDRRAEDSDLHGTVREAVRALADADPGLRRFGAARHRYALRPPLSPAELDAIEHRLGAALPEDLRSFAAEVGAGGAGPGYGVVAIDAAASYAVGAPASASAGAPAGAPWTRALPLVHLGCGYAAIAPLDGDARGQVWIDARVIGVLRPIHGSFTAMYLDWIDRLAHARWPEPHVPPGACALAAALSGYLAHCEKARGLPAGTLAGEPLREALSRLGPGAIEVAAESSVAWFDDGDRVDPCIACARLIDNLADDGLRRDVVAPGLPPRPER
jgi:hypothetical protein